MIPDLEALIAALPWHADHENITDLAHYLVNAHDYDAHNLLEFLDKPWKYEPEWAEYLAHRAGQDAAVEDERALRDLRSGKSV